MNNVDLADHLAANEGLSKADARKPLDGIFEAVTAAAVKSDEISIAGFGKFKVKDSAAREGRNPATGETIQIVASKKLGFPAAKPSRTS